jgi:predicted nucleic acid-binding protein
MKKEDIKIVVLSIIFVGVLFLIALTNVNKMNHTEAVGYILGAAQNGQIELAPNNVIYAHIDTLKNNPLLWDAAESLEVEYKEYELRIIFE